MKKPGKVYAKQARLKGIPQAKPGPKPAGRETAFYWMTPAHKAMLIELAERAEMPISAYLEALITLRYEQIATGMR